MNFLHQYLLQWLLSTFHRLLLFTWPCLATIVPCTVYKYTMFSTLIHSSGTRKPFWGVTTFGSFPNGLGKSRSGVALAIACNPSRGICFSFVISAPRCTYRKGKFRGGCLDTAPVRRTCCSFPPHRFALRSIHKRRFIRYNPSVQAVRS